ncbi:hypothetical protein G6F24_018621 [Rhizopus arrhizus]|nr:hypothetical protein G6F24_018621 [Rhizopus arrhizus]
MADRLSTKATPARPAATLQPYSRMSPSSDKASPQARNCSLYVSSWPSPSVAVPSVSEPTLPWLMIWTAARSLCWARLCVIWSPPS